MRFEPIAIVGEGCVLPGAHSPAEFWDRIKAGSVDLSEVHPEEWRMPPDWMSSGCVEWTGPKQPVAGVVRGFGLDANGFRTPVTEIAGWDPALQWVLHAGRQALGENLLRPRAGLVMGNLGYPWRAQTAQAERIWLEGAPGGGAHDRFCSGLPATLAAAALGLDGGGFALDAACASSLYAIKLACDRLHDRSADLMLAGGVSGSDGLLMAVGFGAMSALSGTGRSRPFQRDADGLIPAEGAALVSLMRLDDAVREGRDVLGVIRAVGLSNDGRSGGFFAPARDGQERAMRQAYELAGIAPDTVSLLECHATGTAVGDLVEVRSAATIFADHPTGLPLGSAKANVGHLLTAAGAAGLIKVLGALRDGIRPALPGCDNPLPEVTGPLRLLTENEPWQGPRRAAVSAFGFGGNNAHLIVESYDSGTPIVTVPEFPSTHRDARDGDGGVEAGTPGGRESAAETDRPGGDPIAVVALGVRTGDGRALADFRRSLLTATPQEPGSLAEVDIDGLRTSPKDLGQSQPQQLLLLEAARDAAAATTLPEATLVLAGGSCDPEGGRQVARWRHDADAAHHGSDRRVDPDSAPPLTAASSLGYMGNILANRVGAHFGFIAPAFSVFDEEASGFTALRLAARALRTGEVDAALVGAVDAGTGAVHPAVAARLGRDPRPGAAAVVMALKRLSDARANGDSVLALLDESPDTPEGLTIGEGGDFDPADLVGPVHAARGMIAAAAAILSLWHRVRPEPGTPAEPAPALRTATAVVRPAGGGERAVSFTVADHDSALIEDVPEVLVFQGDSRDEVLQALAQGQSGGTGPVRLAVVAATASEAAGLSERIRKWLDGKAVRPHGVAYRERPVTGKVAFCFTNGSGTYPRMGRETLLGTPALFAALEHEHGELAREIDWAFRGAGSPDSAMDQVGAAAVLGLVHTALTRDVLGLHPDAIIGYSSGESGAMAAGGAWQRLGDLLATGRASELFDVDLGAPLRAIKPVWERAGIAGERWKNYVVNVPRADVERALADEAAAHLLTVCTADRCVIGGEESAVARVLDRLGDVVSMPIPYDIAAHAPEVAAVRDRWHALVVRPVSEVPGTTFYSCATAEPLELTPENVADAVIAQGIGFIDYPALIERLYADGIRIFVEHGPSGLCTGWIRQILGAREHVAVALDGDAHRGLRGLMSAVAELAAAGLDLDIEALWMLLTPKPPARPAATRAVTVPLLHPPVRIRAGDRPAAPAPAVMVAAVAASAPALSATPARASSAMSASTTTVMAYAAAAPEATLRATGTMTRVPSLRAIDGSVRRQAALALLRHATSTHVRHLGLLARGQTDYLESRDPSRPPGPAEMVGSARHLPRPGESVGHENLLPGPSFDRAQLEHLAVGCISDIFGPLFAVQDDDRRQTRMPAPPLLLADRVLGIDAEPASLGTGTIWTETDIHTDSWYLDSTGRMPPGLLIEAGQADLLLISWLGADLENRGERVYRLLGGEVTFHGPPPAPGSTLSYRISILDHTAHGAQWLFFFEYDCFVDGELLLTVRGGQAGYFTDADLAASSGVLWDPHRVLPPPGTVDPAAARSGRRSFGPAEVRAFAERRPAEVFGPEFDATRCHVRTPSIPSDQLLLLHEVTDFDAAGGPWGRGYLRAETPVGPDDWFFVGHFHNDPCMPGSLMFDGCVQAMSFYLAAAGHTVAHDGWRFEPVPGTSCHLRCRGQVTPQTKGLVYEVFVTALSAGPFPTLTAEVLVTADGVKALHVAGLTVRLVPDWPLDQWRVLGPPRQQETGTAVPLASLGGLAGAPEAGIHGYPAIMAGAWGRDEEYLGPLYQAETRRAARVPGPPYLFMTGIADVSGSYGEFQPGAVVTAHYDIPDRAWYFEQNPGRTMPTAVLMEAVLQPCGWLGNYTGGPLRGDEQLFIRNLDGNIMIHGEVTASDARISTTATLTSVSELNGMVVESFAIESSVDGRPLLSGTTVFGYFTAGALAVQVGMPPADGEATMPGPVSAALPAGRPGMPGPMLLMLDTIVESQPSGGVVGLGRVVATATVDPDAWFFKAHFFQDPVMPGSLGVEAMVQAVQWLLLERDSTATVRRELPLVAEERMVWKYRGQVVPADRQVTVEVDLLEITERGAVAQAWLWVDGRRIYHLPRLGVRFDTEEER
ncbi:beta-ketoacyl synthase N-terminal-like domain-containing protein [Nocardia tengchongensis]|uniref:beta-ketoacyl synthase N-terminal-like domain-containing protein n=1 Tax=Nocardia tengchongensis TaxID=2055889 RepID=UPI0036A9BCB0